MRRLSRRRIIGMPPAAVLALWFAAAILGLAGLVAGVRLYLRRRLWRWRGSPPPDLTVRIYYDGVCNLCTNSSGIVEQWLGPECVTRLPLQTEEARSKGYGGDLVAEFERGGKTRVFSAERAWLELLRYGPPEVSWLGRARRFPPVRWVVAGVYRVVAYNRLRWFGRRTCELPKK